VADLSIQTIARAGITPAYVLNDPFLGDTFSNSGKEFIHAKNESTSDIVITIITPNTVDGLAVADRTVNVPSGQERLIGPFPANVYNGGAGKVTLTYDLDIENLSIAIFNPGT